MLQGVKNIFRDFLCLVGGGGINITPSNKIRENSWGMLALLWNLLVIMYYLLLYETRLHCYIYTV